MVSGPNVKYSIRVMAWGEIIDVFHNKPFSNGSLNGIQIITSSHCNQAF